VTRPTQPPTLAQLAIPHPFMEELGDEVQLLGYELAATEVRPGDTLHLTLFWRALKRMGREYDLLLELQDTSGRVWAEGRFPLAKATYPTTQWTEGEVVRGQYDLIVDAAAPLGECRLALDLVDKATGRRLLGHDLAFAKLRVAGRERQFVVPKTIQHPLRANLGDFVSFLGYDLAETEVEPGGVLHLTLYWQARKKMDASYKVFTHLLDAQNRIWGQRDSIPVRGTYPTTGWLPGEVIVDEYEIPVKPDAPSGDYQLEVGMYDAETMERLTAVDERGQHLPDDRVLLEPKITVGEGP